jgi:rRNA-processing protein FCF1
MKKEKFERFTIENAIIDLEKVNFKEVLESTSPIIFDTNFLFVTFQFNIDLISQIQTLIANNFSLYIYEGTILELQNVQKKGDKNKKYLPLIISMLKRYNFKIIKSDQTYIDDQILENLNKKVIVATNDKKLRQSIQKKGYSVLYLRQKSYLEMN